MQRAVSVEVEGFQVGLVGGEEFETSQEAFPVAGDVQWSLAELIPTVDVKASLFQ